MSEQRQRFEEIFDTLAERFYVDSIVTEQSKVVFVLESPHIQEVKFGAPVSGASGTTMSKHLFGAEYNKPLGRLVKKNAEEEIGSPALEAVGLMNVCGIPMQRTAYKDRAVTERYSDFFDVMAGVRQNNQKDQFKDESWNVLQEVILDRFRERLQKQTQHKCVMVPCGRFAQKFFRLAGITSDHWYVIDEVPHPSYNSWDRERYRPVIQKVQACFQRGREILTSFSAE